jgi:deoxyribose-phosphate aldolase
MSSEKHLSDEDWGKLLEERLSTVSALLSSDLGPELAPLATVSDPADSRLATAIDHTLLKPDATPEQIDVLCEEAISYGFKVRL